MTRDDAEIELAALLLERRRLSRLDLAPSPRVLQRIRTLELFLYGTLRPDLLSRRDNGPLRYGAREWIGRRVRQILGASPPPPRPAPPPLPADARMRAEVAHDTGTWRTTPASPRLAPTKPGLPARPRPTPPPVPAGAAPDAFAPIPQPSGVPARVRNRPAPAPRPSPAPAPAPAPTPAADDHEARLAAWARGHADRHADELARRFGWSRRDAHAALHHAILDAGRRHLEGGRRPTTLVQRTGGKRVKINVKKLPFSRSRRALVRYSESMRETVPDRPAGGATGPDRAPPRPPAPRPDPGPGRDRERIAEDLQMFRQHVRSLHAIPGPRTVRPNTPEEHALLSDFVRKRGLSVVRSPYTYYDDDTHTLFHPTPEDHAAVGAAYVRQGTGTDRFSRRGAAERFAKKPAPVYSDLLRHAAAAMDAPHDDLAIRSFADHLADAHPGPLADAFHQWVSGAANHHVLAPHVAPSKVSWYQFYGPSDRTQVTDPAHLEDATDFEIRQRVGDSPLLPWYGRRWDRDGWTLRRVSGYPHPFYTERRPNRRPLPTVEVARQLYENVGPHALVGAVMGLRHFRPENAANHVVGSGGVRFSRRFLVRYGKSGPVAELTAPLVWTPTEQRVAAKGKAYRQYLQLVRRALANQPGMLPTIDELRAMALFGRSVRGQYAHAHRVLTDFIGPENARLFVAANAILSPQSAWEEHSRGAMRALRMWDEAGRPTGAKNKRAVGRLMASLANERTHDDRRLYSLLDHNKIAKLTDLFTYPEKYLADMNRVASSGWGKITDFGGAFVEPHKAPIDTHQSKLTTPGLGDVGSQIRLRTDDEMTAAERAEARAAHRENLSNFADAKDLARAGVSEDVPVSQSLARVVADKYPGTGLSSALLAAQKRLIAKKPLYKAYKALVGQVAHDLGWEQREAQEAGWAGVVATVAARNLGIPVHQILDTLRHEDAFHAWNVGHLLTKKELLGDVEPLGLPGGHVGSFVAEAGKRPAAGGRISGVDVGPFTSAALRIPPVEQHGAWDAVQEAVAARRGKEVPKAKVKKARRVKAPLKRYALVNRHDFLGGLRRMASSNHADFVARVQAVARRMGMNHTKALPALHDTPTGAVPGVAQAVYGEAPPEKVAALAAWVNGLLPNGPGYAVFHVRPGGPDTLYRLRHDGSGMDVRSKLDRAGIRSRVMIPHRRGFDVLVPDVGNKLGRAVESYAQQHGLSVEASPGHFRTAGSATDQGESRDTFRKDVVRGEQYRRRPARYSADRHDVASLLHQLTLPEHGAHMAGLDDPLGGLRGVAADALDEVGRSDEAALLRTPGQHVEVLADGIVRPSFMERQGISNTYGGPHTREQFTKPSYDGFRDEEEDPEDHHHGFTYWFAKFGVPRRAVWVKNATGGYTSGFEKVGNTPMWYWEPADGEGLHPYDTKRYHPRFREYAPTDALDDGHPLSPSELAFMRHHATTAEFKMARKKGHVWFRLIGAARRALRAVPTGPDYQRLFWHEGNKHAHWVSADGDEEKHVRHIKKALAGVRGVKKVTADAESWPKGEGWREIPVKRGARVAAK